VNTCKTLDRATGRHVADFAPVIPRMRAFAQCLCGGRDEADSVVEAALARACLDRRGRNAGRSLELRLLTLVRDQSRSNARVAMAVPPAVSSLANHRASISDDDTLRWAMRQLPQDDREAVALLDGARTPAADAAAICDCTIATLLNRAASARETLRTLLATGTLATA